MRGNQSGFCNRRIRELYRGAIVGPYRGRGEPEKPPSGSLMRKFRRCLGDRGRGIGDYPSDTPSLPFIGEGLEGFGVGCLWGCRCLAFAPNVRYTPGKLTRKLTSGASEMGHFLTHAVQYYAGRDTASISE